MRWISLFVICSAAVFCLLITPLLLKVQDLLDQYSGYKYVASSLLGHGRHRTQESAVATVGDKIIVMASLESEDTSWVADKLPEYALLTSPALYSLDVHSWLIPMRHCSWQRAIYLVNPSSPVDPSFHELTTPVNKGHEAMAYLTYIIDRYNSSLPSVIAFLHSHRQGFFKAWHVDAPLHDNVLAMRSLQLDFVVQNGYVNLRCNLNPGCTKAYKRLKPHVNGEVWEEIFGGTTTLVTTKMAQNSTTDEPTSSLQDRERANYMHVEVASACCAQFAVSRDQIWRRPLEDYVKIRQWVIDTDRDDADSGRVMEYLWHVIFGKDLV